MKVNNFMVKIIIDIMNGEISCDKIINASINVLNKDENLKLILVGDKKILSKYINLLNNRLEFKYSDEIINMDDNPIEIFFNKKKSSLIIALELLKSNYGDAMVSMANTGALLTCSSLIIKKIKHLRRVALCSILPKKNGNVILLDCGANINCSIEHIIQFAIMGNFYAKNILNISNPKISLLNNGIEKSKGRLFEREAYCTLHNLMNIHKKINFIGNIEPSQIFENQTDVIVCDGFIGNIVLKSLEATSNLFLLNINNLLKNNLLSKLCGWILKKRLLEMKKKFNPKQIGGIPLLGLSKPVIKAHGSSDEISIYNAIFQAKFFYEKKIINYITNDILIEKNNGKI